MAVILTLIFYISREEEDKIIDVRPPAVVTEDELESRLMDNVPLIHQGNKVEVVHAALNNDNKDDDDDDGQEEEDYEDEKMYENNDNKENNKLKAKNNNHHDSNEAAEKNEEQQQPIILLPPKDGSLKFSGPSNDKQKAVVEAFQHAWNGYKTYAWGHDHLRPISKGAQNWFGLGLTLIDSLDTMKIMNLNEEFEEAKEWVRESLSFSINKDVNLFETTIRVLGGLLSAFHLSGDNIFLEKAKDLGQRLMGAFTSASGIPYSDVNLKSTRGHAPKWSPDSSTSEVTTIQLEFRDLSRCTNENEFEEAASKTSDLIHQLEKNEGLVPIFINANTGKFRKYSTISFGARGDSYYEYLLKQWIQTGKREDKFKDDFLESMNGVRILKRLKNLNLQCWFKKSGNASFNSRQIL